MKIIKFFVYCLVLVSISPATEAKFYKYNELRIKDYEEMKEEVLSKINEAKQVAIQHQNEGDDETGDQEAIEILRQALTFIFSRPDTDNMASKLVPLVRSELNNYNAYEEVIAGQVAGALASIKSDKLSPEHKATYLFILENVMAEMQPYLDEDNVKRNEYKRLFEKIRDANIRVENEVKQERHRGLFRTPDLSETAGSVLKKKFPKKDG